MEYRESFFDKLAKSKLFDPFDAEKWHSITHQDIQRAGGNIILSHYNRSGIRALIHLYPELNLKRQNFKQYNGRVDAKQARIFFDEFAKSKGFSPLDAK